MPHYHFHLQFSNFMLPDEEGIALGGLAEARNEAMLTARDILADAIRSGIAHVPEACVVVDSMGTTLHTLSLASLLPEQFRK